MSHGSLLSCSEHACDPAAKPRIDFAPSGFGASDGVGFGRPSPRRQGDKAQCLFFATSELDANNI